ncbi:uncharacterized protein LOC121803909 [Salvia splendens]|uniref:uncharacterized protein LOC121803909 n=1 Tax=Salvia splendens TaxID=180675 RepID=UPI001C277539|nr:uncharacterized protein LOC121803909 [Salvia splendens]
MQLPLRWAGQRRRDCVVEHSFPDGGFTLDENIYLGSGQAWTAMDAVGAWADEEKYYDYDTNSCAAGEMCGHYTQVVWSSTKKIGALCWIFDTQNITALNKDEIWRININRLLTKNITKYTQTMLQHCKTLFTLSNLSYGSFPLTQNFGISNAAKNSQVCNTGIERASCFFERHVVNTFGGTPVQEIYCCCDSFSPEFPGFENNRLCIALFLVLLVHKRFDLCLDRWNIDVLPHVDNSGHVLLDFDNSGHVLLHNGNVGCVLLGHDSLDLGLDLGFVCDAGDVFITCNYSPPGNYVGERPY